jgi:exportin-2 (importin alpha re-exporter)
MAMNMGTPSELTALVGVLQQTLSVSAEPRRAAENSLKQICRQPNGPLLLLSVLRSGDVDVSLRLSAAIAFKNTIKQEWDPEGGHIVNDCKVLVKEHIVGLMCEMPENVMKQLSAALFTIGEYDFPGQWPQLLPQIVQKLGDTQSDFRTINGVLETSNAIFKRFRHAFKNDQLYSELKYCLEQFQVKYARMKMRILQVLMANETPVYVLVTFIFLFRYICVCP